MSAEMAGAAADLDDLLLKTSRTFALSIPRLSEPARRQVTAAYLLFRIADTLEDASGWPRESRLAALAEFAELLSDSADPAARAAEPAWIADPPTAHPGYRELLRETPFVLATFRSLDPGSREVIRRHLLRTAAGMSDFVARSGPSGRLRLRDLDDLLAYCYAVAGLVGEMLTELFVAAPGPAERVAAVLRPRARLFGEGLQLVNILKDTAADLSEGRCFLPSGVSRPRVAARAREDLVAAAEYVLALHGAAASRGLLAFTALPVLLARSTLDRIAERGPGSKLARGEVLEIVARLDRALERGEPPLDAR